MTIIIETKTKLVKNPNTKTTYLTESVEKSYLTEKQYNLTVNDDTLKWFRRLGGSETAQRSYTCFGYKVYKLTSKSPDRQTQVIREFQFYSIGWKESEIFKNLFKSYENGVFYLKRFKEGKTLIQLKKIINKKAA